MDAGGWIRWWIGEGRGRVRSTKSTVNRRLDDPDQRPDDALIESILGRRFGAWKGFVRIIEALPSLCAEWRYYSDGKSWLYKVTEGKQTICWVSARSGTFTATFYVASQHAREVQGSGVDSDLVSAWRSGKPGAKTRPITVEVRRQAQLADVRRLVDLKRRIR
jgi:hypothetical protein